MIELIQLVIERYRYHSTDVLSRASPPLTPVGADRESERGERVKSTDDLDRSERRKGPIGLSSATGVGTGGISGPVLMIPSSALSEEEKNRYDSRCFRFLTQAHHPQVHPTGGGHQGWFELCHQVSSCLSPAFHRSLDGLSDTPLS
jgi:hypothetical protein